MGDSKSNAKPSSSNGSCIPMGVPESDTGDSGEESEPTYRHYDHFETDVCLTQDEDEPLPSNVPIIQTTTPRKVSSQDPVPRGPFPGTTASRGVSSDSDSCTESEMFPERTGRNTDGTTTSTSESEETQIWVPVSNRPYGKPVTGSPPPSGASSNGSDGHSRSPSVLPPSRGLTTGSLSIITSPGTEIKLKDDGRRGSCQNTMTSVISKRTPPTKHMSLGLLRHDEGTGTITLDIHNVQNGDLDTDNTEDRDFPSPNKSTRRTRERLSDKDTAHTLTGDMCGLLSILYAVVVMVAGLGISVAEVYVSKPIPGLFEGFYILLLIVSIAFLVFVFSYMVRLKTLRSDRIVVTRTPVHRKQTVDNQTGGFYIRLGAVFFGIGSMIKSGLHFGESFEMTNVPECNNVLHAVRPMVQIVFTFTQLYFVFFNSKMCIHHYQYLAKFGLMHMVATNICIWFDDVVKETLRNLNVTDDTENKTVTVSDAKIDVVGSDCYGDSLMGEVVRTSGPYLYPCSVQYSLIAASLLFVMCYKVSEKSAQMTYNEELPKTDKTDVDCSSSSRGLFLGIIVLVAIVIMTITFFVLVQTNDFRVEALRLEHISDLVVYVIMTLSVIIAYYRMRILTYWYPGRQFEHVLLFISLIAVFILCICNMMAGAFYTEFKHGLLLGLSSLMHLIQASVQFLFLCNMTKRSAMTRDQAVNKAGREFVTFALICNIAVWGLNVFINQRWNEHDLQKAFYGDVSWNIIIHLTVPLSLFFRFLSIVLLVNVWMHSWNTCSDPNICLN